MTTKTFDCVQMKDAAQRACARACAGLPLPERRKKMAADMLADREFAKLYQRFFPRAAARVCEPKTEYGSKTESGHEAER